MYNRIILVFGLLYLLNQVHGSNILMVAINGDFSHKKVFFLLADALASKGHNVTVATSDFVKDAHPNVGQVIIPTRQNQTGITNDLKEVLKISRNGNPFAITADFVWITALANMITLHTAEYIAFLKNPPPADVIIMDAAFDESSLVLSHLLKAPLVYISTCELMAHIAWGLNVPTPFAHIPHFASSYSNPMSFWERLTTIVLNLGYRLMPMLDKEIATLFPGTPPLVELEGNVSMVFVNRNPVITGARPLLPNIVEIGGIHLTRPGPLNKVYQEAIATTNDEGFVVFSMGSYLGANLLPEEVQIRVFKMLSRLDYTVLMRWQGEPYPNPPSNVRMFRWLPQLQLLAHPKCILFINHCGMLGIQESLAHGVPMVGIPILGDQFSNAARIKHLGAGEYASILDNTEEELLEVVRKVLSNPEYKNAAMKIKSELFDFPMRPLDSAVFWTEYVIRNKGAPQLQSAAKHIPLYQYFLLDVVCVAVIFVVFSAVALRFVTAIIIHTLRHLFITYKWKLKLS